MDIDVNVGQECRKERNLLKGSKDVSFGRKKKRRKDDKDKIISQECKKERNILKAVKNRF